MVSEMDPRYRTGKLGAVVEVAAIEHPDVKLT
jgi:hypothetical protein